VAAAGASLEAARRDLERFQGLLVAGSGTGKSRDDGNEPSPLVHLPPPESLTSLAPLSHPLPRPRERGGVRATPRRIRKTRRRTRDGWRRPSPGRVGAACGGPGWRGVGGDPRTADRRPGSRRRGPPHPGRGHRPRPQRGRDAARARSAADGGGRRRPRGPRRPPARGQRPRRLHPALGRAGAHHPHPRPGSADRLPQHPRQLQRRRRPDRPALYRRPPSKSSRRTPTPTDQVSRKASSGGSTLRFGWA
jgi:hypothetical protein